jgi:hypothetical protein
MISVWACISVVVGVTALNFVIIWVLQSRIKELEWQVEHWRLLAGDWKRIAADLTSPPTDGGAPPSRKDDGG